MKAKSHPEAGDSFSFSFKREDAKEVYGTFQRVKAEKKKGPPHGLPSGAPDDFAALPSPDNSDKYEFKS